MIKVEDVKGIKLNINYARDQVAEVEQYFSHPAMQTVELISTKVLLEACEKGVLQKILSDMNMVIATEPEIFDVLQLESVGRRREAMDGQFLDDLFRKMEWNRKTLMVIGSSASTLQKAEEKLKDRFPRMKLLGSYCLDEKEQNGEQLVNEMNSYAPDAVCSLLTSPEQELFIEKYQEQMNAKLWIGAGSGTYFSDGKRNMLRWWEAYTCKNKLKKILADGKNA